MNYQNLITPENRKKQRFMALLSAILEQVNDLFSLVQEKIPEAFSLETAAGKQLDTLGVLVNTPRPAGADDEDYRALLRARIAMNHWNGTNETLPEALAFAFPDTEAQINDCQDGSVTAAIDGYLPFSLKEMFPCPAIS